MEKRGESQTPEHKGRGRWGRGADGEEGKKDGGGRGQKGKEGE